MNNSYRTEDGAFVVAVQWIQPLKESLVEIQRIFPEAEKIYHDDVPFVRLFKDSGISYPVGWYVGKVVGGSRSRTTGTGFAYPAEPFKAYFIKVELEW